MWIGHCKEVRKLTFRASGLRRSESTIDIAKEFTDRNTNRKRNFCIFKYMMYIQYQYSIIRLIQWFSVTVLLNFRAVELFWMNN